MTEKYMSQKNIYISAVIACLILIVLLGLYAFASDGGREVAVYMSEVCPHNDTVRYDSVGYYHDFIKITNSGKEEINLKGYGLSDDNTDLIKYEFPDVTLKAGEDILVWADEQSVYYDAVGNMFEDVGACYSGFPIRDHEMIYLTTPQRVVVDALRIPSMKKDEVFMRSGPKDKGTVLLNGIEAKTPYSVSDSVTVPDLSVLSGFYDSPFELVVDGHGKDVLFTTDGSDPRTNGTRLTGPIPVYDRSASANDYASRGPVSLVYELDDIPVVGKSFIVRAVALGSDNKCSRECVATYFIGEGVRDICDDTYILSLVSDPEGLFSNDRGIYVPGDVWDLNREQAEEYETDLRYAPANYNMRGRRWRRPARAMLFDKDGSCLYDEDITINIRGGSSRAMLQKSMALKPVNAGDKVFDGLIPGAGDSLDLRTGGEDEVFMTNFRDTLNSEIARNMNVGAQRSVCCQVFLDGEYWGCYNLQDHLNTAFVEARYGVTSDNVILVKNHDVASGLEADLNEFFELEEYVRNNDMSDEENYRAFCGMVDIDSLIDYYCAEIFFANSDAYINNVALWRARNTGYGDYEDGRWRFLLFDTDESDSIWDDWSDKDTFVSGNWMGYNPDTELYFSNLSKNAEFRKMFRDRFNHLLDNDLAFESTGPIIDRFEEEYKRPMVRSVQRFGRADFTEGDYEDNVETVRNFFRNRCKYMSEYIMQHMGDQ